MSWPSYTKKAHLKRSTFPPSSFFSPSRSSSSSASRLLLHLVTLDNPSDRGLGSSWLTRPGICLAILQVPCMYLSLSVDLFAHPCLIRAPVRSMFGSRPFFFVRGGREICVSVRTFSPRERIRLPGAPPDPVQSSRTAAAGKIIGYVRNV